MPVVSTTDLLNFKFKYKKEALKFFEKNNDCIDLIISLLNENLKLNEYKKYLLKSIIQWSA